MTQNDTDTAAEDTTVEGGEGQDSVEAGEGGEAAEGEGSDQA